MRAMHREPATATRRNSLSSRGPVVGYAWRGVRELRQVWIEAHRGRGLGTAQMNEAIREARTRGCCQIFRATYDFQAPGFYTYAKLGFRPVAELPDKPVGHTEIVMCLSLTEDQVN